MALGSFYVALTKQFCEHLFSNTKMIELLAYMPGVKIPDELFFSTALLGSNKFRCTHINTNFRYTSWGRTNLHAKPSCSLEKEIIEQKGEFYLRGGSHPCILGSDEIKNEAKVATPLAFFANKFEINMIGSEAALNFIDQEIDKYEASYMKNNNFEMESAEIKNLMIWADRGWPHPLHCPNYQGRGT